MAIAKDELKTLVTELHKPARKPKEFRHVVTSGIDDVWGVDLAEFGRYKDDNDGLAYWMVVEDIFSRYCWVVGIKDKTAASTLAALNTVFKEAGATPRHIWADQGSEFHNRTWAPRLKEIGATLYTTFHEVGVGPVERLIKTLKYRIYPEFELQGSHRWIELMPRIVDDYNNDKHSRLGMSPTQARMPSRESALWEHQYGETAGEVSHAKPKFHVGQWVRVSVNKGVFERGWEPNWSYEPYTIDKVLNTKPVTYKVRDRPTLKDPSGEVIRGSFYEQELMATTVPDAGFIEVIPGTESSVGGVKGAVVHYVGVHKKQDTWMSNDTILEFGARKPPKKH